MNEIYKYLKEIAEETKNNLPLYIAILFLLYSASTVVVEQKDLLKKTEKTIKAISAVVTLVDFTAQLLDGKKLKTEDLRELHSRYPEYVNYNNALLLTRERKPGYIAKLISEAKHISKENIHNPKTQKEVGKIADSILIEDLSFLNPKIIKSKYQLSEQPQLIIISKTEFSGSNTTVKELPVTEYNEKDNDFIPKEKMDRFMIFFIILITSALLYHLYIYIISEK